MHLFRCHRRTNTANKQKERIPVLSGSGCQASVQILTIEIAGGKLEDGHRHRPKEAPFCRGEMQPCRLGGKGGRGVGGTHSRRATSRQGWLTVGEGLGGE